MTVMLHVVDVRDYFGGRMTMTMVIGWRIEDMICEMREI